MDLRIPIPDPPRLLRPRVPKRRNHNKRGVGGGFECTRQDAEDCELGEVFGGGLGHEEDAPEHDLPCGSVREEKRKDGGRRTLKARYLLMGNFCMRRFVGSA